MAKKAFPLANVYKLIEPGPVVMVTTARRGRANVMTMSWLTMMEFTGNKVDKFAKFGLTPVPASLVQAPLIDECYANLECRIYDSLLVNKYNFFVLEVVKAWIDPSRKDPRTLHHRGRGLFAIDGETIKLPFNKP